MPLERIQDAHCSLSCPSVPQIAGEFRNHGDDSFGFWNAFVTHSGADCRRHSGAELYLDAIFEDVGCARAIC